MGRRGPPPRPTKLRLLEGARPERVNPHEPQGRPGAPVEAPAHIDDLDVRAAYDDIVTQVPFGVTTGSDGIALEVSAHRLATFRRAAALTAAVGPIVRDERGLPRTNPAERIARHAALDVIRLCREFGMTPASRAYLSTRPVVPDVEAERIRQRYLSPPSG